MQSRIATLSLLVLMVLALWWAGRRQGGNPAPAAGLAQAVSQTDAHAPAASPVQQPAVPETPQEPTNFDLNDATWRKLQTRISAPFAEIPLSDVLSYIADKTGTRTYVDARALEDIAVELENATVTMELEEVPAEMVLELALSQFDLGYYLRSGVIIVTSMDVAERHTEVRIYPVADLVGRDYGRLEHLREVIENTIQPDSWDQQGGLGTIESFDALLIVRQTSNLHRKIEVLLRQIRDAMREAAG